MLVATQRIGTYIVYSSLISSSSRTCLESQEEHVEHIVNMYLLITYSVFQHSQTCTCALYFS